MAKIKSAQKVKIPCKFAVVELCNKHVMIAKK